MAKRRWLILFLAGVLMAGTARTEDQFDQWGRLERLPLGKDWLLVGAEVKVPLKGWKKTLALSDVQTSAAVSSGGGRTWKALLRDGAETAAEVAQTVHESGGRLLYDLNATGNGKLDTEGVYFWLDIPCEHFAGGSYRLGGGTAAGDEPPLSGALPVTLPAEFRLCSAVTNKVVLADAAGKLEFVLELDPPAHVLVQDGRKWSPHFSILVDIHTGNLDEGENAALRAQMFLRGELDDAPARLALDPATARYRLLGLGGNYCFNLESPVTRYTLDNLKVAFARTEMSLVQWAPEEDRLAPGLAGWRKLAAGDAPGSRLRLEFEIMGELSRKKIPYITTIWYLPAWAYTKPPNAGKHEQSYCARQVAPSAPEHLHLPPVRQGEIRRRA